MRPFLQALKNSSAPISSPDDLLPPPLGFLYLSETNIGLEIPDFFVEVVKSKVRSGKWMSGVVLVSKKVTASEAVDMGVVDLAVVGEKVTVEAAVRLRAELATKRWDGVVREESGCHEARGLQDGRVDDEGGCDAVIMACFWDALQVFRVIPE